MCGDPVTMGLMAAGTAVQTIGTIRDADESRQAARANAEANRQQAGIERTAGQFNVAALRRDQTQDLARMRAQAFSQGTTLGQQQMDILANEEKQAEVERQAVIFDSEARAQSFEQQARLDKFQAKQFQKSKPFRAAAAVLSGATRMAGTFSPSAGAGRQTAGTSPSASVATRGSSVNFAI